jgi:hypothetical protein
VLKCCDKLGCVHTQGLSKSARGGYPGDDGVPQVDQVLNIGETRGDRKWKQPKAQV